MITTDNFTQVIKEIVKGSAKKGRKSLDELKNLLEKEGWPNGLSRKDILNGLQFVIEEKLPSDPAQALVDLALCQKRKPAEVSSKQRDMLKELRNAITESRALPCSHKNIGVGAFLHGGGFISPTYALPEIICLDCGLNVTLHHNTDPEKIGIKITAENLKKLCEWANESVDRYGYIKSRTCSANEITHNVFEAYKNTRKWEKKIPLRIVNKALLESKSGL